MRLTPKDRRLILAALWRAIEWEESLADAWNAETPEHVLAKAMAESFRAIRLRIDSTYGEPRRNWKRISVQELAARGEPNAD